MLTDTARSPQAGAWPLEFEKITQEEGALLTESCLQLSARLLARSVRLRTFQLYLALAVT